MRSGTTAGPSSPKTASGPRNSSTPCWSPSPARTSSPCRDVSGALLVAGTTSDAGKSMVVAGLCRLLARKGIRVAPFKAQNMSNNSAVTVERGEIGRAQAMQARAAGLEPSVRFNPILLKPGSDRSSQLVIRGQVADSVTAAGYVGHRDRLARLGADEVSCRGHH